MGLIRAQAQRGHPATPGTSSGRFSTGKPPTTARRALACSSAQSMAARMAAPEHWREARMPSTAGRGVVTPPSLSSGVVRVRKSKSAARIMAWCPSACPAEVFSVGAIHYRGRRIMKPVAALVLEENEEKPKALICFDCFQSSVSLSKPKDNESPPACSRFGKV